MQVGRASHIGCYEGAVSGSTEWKYARSSVAAAGAMSVLKAKKQ